MGRDSSSPAGINCTYWVPMGIPGPYSLKGFGFEVGCSAAPGSSDGARPRCIGRQPPASPGHPCRDHAEPVDIRSWIPQGMRWASRTVPKLLTPSGGCTVNDPGGLATRYQTPRSRELNKTTRAAGGLCAAGSMMHADMGFRNFEETGILPDLLERLLAPGSKTD